MRRSSSRYLLLVMVASCTSLYDWCDPKHPLEPDICVIPTRHQSRGDLVTASAPPAGTTACTAGATSPATGQISSTHDIDVSRTGMCSVTSDPSAELLTDDPAVRVCMFYNCTPGTTNVFDCYESSPLDSRGSNETESQKKRDKTHVVKGITESGFSGCCRTGKGRVTAQLQCSGIFAAKIEGYLWVEATDDKTHDYSVTYQLQ